MIFNANLNILERRYMGLILGEYPWCSNPKHIYFSNRLELFHYLILQWADRRKAVNKLSEIQFSTAVFVCQDVSVLSAAVRNRRGQGPHGQMTNESRWERSAT